MACDGSLEEEEVVDRDLYIQDLALVVAIEVHRDVLRRSFRCLAVVNQALLVCMEGQGGHSHLVACLLGSQLVEDGCSLSQELVEVGVDG
jgi:hypothetical protein